MIGEGYDAPAVGEVWVKKNKGWEQSRGGFVLSPPWQCPTVRARSRFWTKNVKPPPALVALTSNVFALNGVDP